MFMCLRGEGEREQRERERARKREGGVQLESFVPLGMCQCHPTVSPPPPSLTSTAISEAAVEAALF